MSTELGSDKDITRVFTGSIFVFYAFDIGDDINLQKVKESQALLRRPLNVAKYFKGYHTPLEVEVPHPHTTSRCVSAKLHNFGVMSLTYKVSFTDTLEDLREFLGKVQYELREQSINDAGAIFKQIKKYVKQPKFFHLHKSYMVIQVDHLPPEGTVTNFQDEYGHIIASLLRSEVEHLSDYQKNEILASSIGYYKGDLITIDSEASFVYDDEYEEILDLFEFANLQQLELHYFDKVLNDKLNEVYETEVQKVPLMSYIPFVGDIHNDPTVDLGKLQVDISVITERLDNSIKVSGETYFAELYAVLGQKLELKEWRGSINHKLNIIKDVYTVHEDKVAAVREDLLSVLVILLIFIELIVGILHLIRG
jgi:hypothetical protein